MEHGTPHFFKVALETPDGWSDWSNIVACVPPQPELPGKCAAVFPVVKDDTTACIRWTKPIDYAAAAHCGEIRRYKVLVTWPEGERELEWEGDLDSAEVPGLDCLTDYRFQVAAENVTGWGEWSDPSPVLQMPPPVPPKLQMPTLRRATHHTAVIQWQHPPSSGVPVDSFRFRWTTAPGFPPGGAASPDVYELEDVPPNASQYTISGLAPGHTYIFQVRALNRFGQGIWSNSSIPIKTADGREPGKVQNLSAPNVYKSFITLRWSPASPNGHEVTRHVLRCATTPDLEGAQEIEPVVVRKNDMDTCDLRHLQKVTHYFQVAAFNSVGPSPWSDPLCVDLRVVHQLEDA